MIPTRSGSEPPHRVAERYTFSVVSLNVGRSLGVLDDWFSHHAQGRQLDNVVILLQECPGQLRNRDSYNGFTLVQAKPNTKASYPGARSFCRAAILFPKECRVHSAHRCAEDAVSTEILIGGSRVNFISFYADKKNPIGDMIETLGCLLSATKDGAVVVGGDTNSCSSLWSPQHNGNNRLDVRWKRGKELELLLAENALQTLNRIEAGPTHIPYDSRKKASYIDVIAGRGLHWLDSEVENSVGDHRPIKVTFRQMGLPPRAKPRRNPNKTNWEVFDSSLAGISRTIPTVRNSEDIDEWATRLMTALKRAVVVSTPQQKGKKTTRQNWEWWTKELGKERKKLRKLQRSVRAKHRNNESDAGLSEELRKARRSYFNAISRAKSDHYRRTMTELTDSQANRLIKYKHSAKTEYSSEEVLSYYVGNNRPRRDTAERARNQGLLNTLGGKISDDEIKAVVSQIRGKKKKAPGWDGASYEHVARALNLTEAPWRLQFVKLLETSLDWGHYPQPFKRADWVLLDKGRGEGPRAFRPISLTSTTGKTMEVVIKNRLTRAIGNPPEGIHGFTRSRSTITALAPIVGMVQDRNQTDGETVLCTWDLKSAFDHVSHPHIVGAVIQATSSEAWGIFIEDYLHGHTVTLDGNTRVRTKGITQGGSLSPCLFCIGTYSLEGKLRSLSPANGAVTVKPRIFADDIMASIHAKEPVHIVQGILDSSNAIEEWARGADLETDPAKHEILCLREGTKETIKDLLARTQSEDVSCVKDRMKWLGVMISGNWRDHAIGALSKSTAILAKCRRMNGLDWGLSPVTLLKVWQSSVLSTLLYACEIWCPALEGTWFINQCCKLEAILGRALTGAVRNAPSELLSKAASTVIRSAWWQARRRVVKFWLHGSAPKCPDALIKLFRKWGVAEPVGSKEHSKSKVWDIPASLVVAIDDTREPRTDGENLKFYSDGSLVKDGKRFVEAGVGVVKVGSDEHTVKWLEGFRAFKIDGPANICQAEQLGVLKSLEWGLSTIRNRSDSGETTKSITILLDSRAALQSVIGSKETELISRIRNTISLIAEEGVNVRLSWTKGHAGHPPNEAADWAAAYGRKGGNHSETIRLRTPYSYTCREIDIQAETELEERWERKGKDLACNRLGLTLGREQLRIIMRRTLKMDKKTRRKVWELITFHGNTRGYKGRSKAYTGQDRTCRYCRRFKENLAHWSWCDSRYVRKMRWKAFQRRVPDLGCSRHTEVTQGIKLIRESLIGDGLWKLAKFLKFMAPEWSSGGDHQQRPKRTINQ